VGEGRTRGRPPIGDPIGIVGGGLWATLGGAAGDGRGRQHECAAGALEGWRGHEGQSFMPAGVSCACSGLGGWLVTAVVVAVRGRWVGFPFYTFAGSGGTSR